MHFSPRRKAAKERQNQKRCCLGLASGARADRWRRPMERLFLAKSAKGAKENQSQRPCCLGLTLFAIFADLARSSFKAGWVRNADERDRRKTFLAKAQRRKGRSKSKASILGWIFLASWRDHALRAGRVHGAGERDRHLVFSW